jgi:hypothetical protein
MGGFCLTGGRVSYTNGAAYSGRKDISCLLTYRGPDSEGLGTAVHRTGRAEPAPRRRALATKPNQED